MVQNMRVEHTPLMSRRAALAGVLASSAAVFLKPAGALASPSPDVGRAWLGLRMARRDGMRFALDDVPGRRVVVAFWDATCAVCRDEIPALGQAILARSPDEASLVLVSYPTAWDQDYAMATQFGLARHACTVSAEADPDLLAAAITERNGLFRVPQSFVFARSAAGEKLSLVIARIGRLHGHADIL